MNGDLLGKYGARTEPRRMPEPEEPPAESDDFGAFSMLRGIRDRALSLELRRKDGTIRAIPYALIECAEYDPSEGITLTVQLGKRIRIRGRNLNAEVRPAARLFEGIARHRVTWLQQASEPDLLEAAENATVIEEIQW